MLDPYVEALADIIKETKRQESLWGIQRHQPDKWLTILMEEVGEAAESMLDGDTENLETEVTQVAAVALSWLEDIKRGKER